MGHLTTSCAGVVEGRLLRHAVRSQELAGHHLAMRMGLLLALHQGTDKIGAAEARATLEQTCAIAPRCESEREPERCVLPDGSVVLLNGGSFDTECAEMLFDPRLGGAKDDVMGGARHDGHIGVHQLLAEVLGSVWCHSPRFRYGVVLYGGCAQIPNISNRMSSELSVALASNAAPTRSNYEPHVSVAPHNACWIGGSVEASLSSMYSRWAFKMSDLETGTEGFDEVGPRMALQKFDNFAVAH